MIEATGGTIKGQSISGESPRKTQKNIKNLEKDAIHYQDPLK